jgi:hypothetical protein
MFITLFINACDVSHSWTRWIHSTRWRLISLSAILILSSNLRLGLPRGLFPSDFLTEVLSAFLFCPISSECHEVQGRVWHFAACWFWRRRVSGPCPPPPKLEVHPLLLFTITYSVYIFHMEAVCCMRTPRCKVTGTHLPRTIEFSNWYFKKWTALIYIKF